MTLTSLLSCLVTCSSAVPSTLTRMVMREISGCSVGPTASDSMLKPRRLNSPDTRARTPGLFSTRTDSVWVVICSLIRSALRASAHRHVRSAPRSLTLSLHDAHSLVLVEDRPDSPGGLDVVVART